MSDADTIFQRGWSAHQQGRMTEARDLYLQTLKLKGDHADAHHLLGLLLEESGQRLEALEHLGRSVDLAPGSEVAQTNYAVVLAAAGQEPMARAHLRQSLKLNPEYAPAHFNLGRLNEQDGDTDAAVLHYRQAVMADPDHAPARNNLAGLLSSRGQVDEALEHYTRAIGTADNPAEIHSNLGDLLRRLGRADDAIGHYLHALRIDPEMIACRHQFVSTLEYVSDPGARDGLLEEAERCFRVEGINKQDLGVFLLGVIASDPALKDLLEAICTADDAALRAGWLAGRWDALWNDAWISHLLEHTYLSYPVLETCFTRLRELILADVLGGGRQAEDDEGAFVFLCRLARHGFNGEWIFRVSDDERGQIDRLASQLIALAGEGELASRAGQARLALWGSYASLAASPVADALRASPTQGWHPLLRELIRLDVVNRDLESVIADDLSSISPIRHPIHRDVQQMYEENPFPRWISLSRHARPRTPARALHHLFPHAVLDARLDRPAEILVAGCGTGQHALQVASRFRHTNVLAVDLSRRSLAYGVRQSRGLPGVDHIRFLHGDLMELGGGERRFDVIESIGVLHHTSDWRQGWRVLAGLLNEGGAMKIGLYSETARTSIAKIREIIAQRGLTGSIDDMRALRVDILEDPAFDDVRDVIRYGDFYNASTCRDLLFHVQEERVTIPQIREMLDELGLTFIGWELADLGTVDDYRRAHPEDPAMTDLDAWHAFEQTHPRAFEQCYQLWCVKA